MQGRNCFASGPHVAGGIASRATYLWGKHIRDLLVYAFIQKAAFIKIGGSLAANNLEKIVDVQQMDSPGKRGAVR